MTSLPPGSALPSPQRLIQLLLESGWTQISGRPNSYLRLLPPDDELGRRQSLVVPLEVDAPDFPELMHDAIDALRHLPSNGAALTMLSRLTTSPTDQFAFAKETAAPRGWIQWDEGETLITSARGILTAGAKITREKLTYFGNRYGQFANRFLDEVMMGQTEVGSYVVRAYVPVDRAIPLRGGREAEGGLHFAGQDAIAAREVSQAVAGTIKSTQEAIDHYRSTSSLSAFRSPELALSYEAVTAIKKLAEHADHARISVTWEHDVLTPQVNEEEFIFTSSAVPILERAANELVKPEPARNVTAIGTVHLLSRSDAGGPGIIGITTLEGQPAKKMRVHLQEEDYHRALSAHDEGKAVQVSGNLEKEGNLSWLYQAHLTRIIDRRESEPVAENKPPTLPF